MDLGLSGRRAMVAAASKGIGKAVATALASEGCRVSISSRSAENLVSAKAEILEIAPKAQVLAITADVQNPQDLARWHSETEMALGGVDILVTNTGGPPAARFADLTEEQWRTGIDSTLMNVVRLSRLVLPGMRAQRWGRIIHVTSFVAKQPMDLLTISSTLRAGLSALTKTMSNQFAPDNVLVNAVMPGNVATDRQRHLNEIRSKEEGIPFDAYVARAASVIPLKRFAEPRELADVIAFLASDRASYMTGSTLQVDGGLIQSTF